MCHKLHMFVNLNKNFGSKKEKCQLVFLWNTHWTTSDIPHNARQRHQHVKSMKKYGNHSESLPYRYAVMQNYSFVC